MITRNGKEQVYRLIAQVGKAVSSPARLEILDLLCQGEKSVETVAREIGQKVGNTSAHLKALRAARLVDSRKVGKYACYRAADPDVAAFLLSLRHLAARRLAEVRETVQACFTHPNAMEPVPRRELVARVKRGEVTLIDVRPEDEYRAGHLPGAVMVPPSTLTHRLKSLPRDREIVAYCRGPYCMFAPAAVRLLRKRGFRAVHMAEGVMEWRAAGLPIVEGREP